MNTKISTMFLTTVFPGTLSKMKKINLNILASICWLIFFSGTLALTHQTLVLAAPPSEDSLPQVFLPHETQHGFAEFDSPPSFFENEASSETIAPYTNYSNSPNLPSSDHKPGGLFANLVFAESVEEDRTIRRGHILVPVNPTNTFPPTAKSVYLVFAVHEHLAPFQIIGRLFPEEVPGTDSSQWIDEDRADLALEDESGYLKFFAADGKWKPGRYRVDVYVGYMVNTMNKMGTMRFSIDPDTDSRTIQP